MSSKTDTLLQEQTRPLRWPEMIAYAVGFGGNSLVNLGFGTYLTFFWTDIAMIPLAYIGTITLVSRIFDGFTDVATGFIIDRTNSKYGKARPWLFRMSIPGAISLMLLFYVPDFGPTGKVMYAFLTYNLVAYFVLTATTIPLQSMLSRITDEPKKRVTLNMMGMIMSTSVTVIGNMVVQKGIAAFGGGKDGYFRFFSLFAVLAMCLYMTTFFGTRERVNADAAKGGEKISIKEAIQLFALNKWWWLVTFFTVCTNLYPAFMAINMHYMTWVMGDASLMAPYQSTFSTALLITLIVTAPIVPKIGKIKASFSGMFFQLVGNFVPLIFRSVPALFVAAALRGIGPALLLGTSLAFICDVVDYGEWKTGRRSEGIIFSGSSMGGKIGLGLGGIVVAFMLSTSGYTGGAAVQPESAVNAIRLTFTVLPSIGSFACTIILFFLSKLDRQMPQILADLEQRKIDAAALKEAVPEEAAAE